MPIPNCAEIIFFTSYMMYLSVGSSCFCAILLIFEVSFAFSLQDWIVIDRPAKTKLKNRLTIYKVENIHRILPNIVKNANTKPVCLLKLYVAILSETPCLQDIFVSKCPVSRSNRFFPGHCTNIAAPLWGKFPKLFLAEQMRSALEAN